jgi:hypothetical protein
MKTAQSRFNSWNTQNASFVWNEKRPASSQKVVESRQESYRNNRLRRVKSAVGAQRALNPNVERMLKRNKNRMKQAKPARHFKAWNNRDTTPVERVAQNRKNDSVNKLRTVGAKNASSNFAQGLRGGGTGIVRRARKARGKPKRQTSADRRRAKGNKLAADRQAELAQVRMRKAKSAALKARQMEQQIQHVRRIKKLDTTIRPVLGTRTNILEDGARLHPEHSAPAPQYDDDQENPRPHYHRSSDDQDECDDDGEGIGSMSAQELDKANGWNPTFGNILSPLPEAYEEGSQSFNQAEANQILHSARRKTPLRTVHTISEEVRREEHEHGIYSDDQGSEDENDEESDQIRISGIYNAVSPPRTTESMKHSASIPMMQEEGDLHLGGEPNESDGGDDDVDPELLAHRRYQASCKPLSASLDEGTSSSDESSDDEEGMGVEHLARANFYSGLNRKTSPKKSPAATEAETIHGAAAGPGFEEGNDVAPLAEADGEDDDYAEESFADLEDSKGEFGDHKVFPAEDEGEEDDEEEDDYAEESFVELDEPKGGAGDSKASSAEDEREVDDEEDDYAEESFAELDEDEDAPEWDTPRSRAKREAPATTTPRTFGKSHMAFLRDLALEQWTGPSVTDSVEDDSSINSKFRNKLKDQLRKELAHSDSKELFERNPPPSKQKAIAFVC